jgi:hypothetical protein
MINLVCLSNPASSSLCYILQVEFSCVGTRILNLECAVLPPGNKNEAIPLDATVNTIFFCERKDEARVRHIKVLPVPPYPCKKKAPLFGYLLHPLFLHKYLSVHLK